LVDQFLGVAFNQEERAIYDHHWVAVQTYMLEKQKSWILGTSDVNHEWAEYQETIESLGLSKVLDAMQSAYDRQYGQ
jgi:putative aldouronate transport system substrate-binding protein